ncbi:DNA-binding protein, partial [Halorhodospira halophila]
MAITTEQIHAAADAITARGERPTLTAVRRELGGGSF